SSQPFARSIACCFPATTSFRYSTRRASGSPIGRASSIPIRRRFSVILSTLGGSTANDVARRTDLQHGRLLHWPSSTRDAVESGVARLRGPSSGQACRSLDLRRTRGRRAASRGGADGKWLEARG